MKWHRWETHGDVPGQREKGPYRRAAKYFRLARKTVTMMLIDEVMEIFADDIAREDARPPAVRENFATQLLISRSRGFVDDVILQSHQLFKDRHAA
jgi:hypothetical protein